MSSNLKFSDIARALEQFAPPSLAESYDNVGLIVGEPNTPCTGVLINLDVTEELLDEAKALGINLIVTHHPIWFSGIKRLNGENYVSRIILKAIRNGIGLYACHTNLDNVQEGVNRRIGQQLGIEEMQVLSSKPEQLLFMICHLPESAFDKVSAAIEAAGARHVRTAAMPEGGLLEAIVPHYLKSRILQALRAAHPDDSPEIHLMPTLDSDASVGSGMIGNLPQPMPKAAFLAMVKRQFGCGGIRYADSDKAMISKVAWCGGAGSFLIGKALSSGADAFVTGDITYHKYFDNEGRILLLDIGHHESEQFTSELLLGYLSKSFRNFAVRLSEINTNPVKYF